jgi:hypothetical protein
LVERRRLPTDWRLIFAVVITALWAVGYIVSLAEHDPEVVAGVTPVMLIVAAFLLARGGRG